MESKIIAGRRPGRLLASLSLIALSLAACNKRADQITATEQGTQPAMAPPLAALPLATAEAPNLAAAPEASQLPWPKQKIRTAPRSRYDRYGYIDSAYDMGYAFADTPPDYTVDYDGAYPWIWRSGGGAYRIVEWLPYGERDYYYAPGEDYPFFVNDPYYSYAYDDGVLVGLYDPYGYAIDDGWDEPRIYNATRYYYRARDLYRAANYYPRRSAYAEHWISHRNYLSGRRNRWEQQQRRDPDWRQWRARNERNEERQWRPERDQRLHYAMASAAGFGAVRDRMQRRYREQGGQQRFAGFGDRGGRELRGQQQQFGRDWQANGRRDGRDFRPDRMNREEFASRQLRDGRFAGNGFDRRAMAEQRRGDRQNRFASGSFFEQRRAEREARQRDRGFGRERMGRQEQFRGWRQGDRGFRAERMNRQEFAGRQQRERRFADRSAFQERRAMQEQGRAWRNRDQGARMERMRERREFASREPNWARQRQMFEGRRNAERGMRQQFEQRQQARFERRERPQWAMQQREARRGMEMQQREARRGMEMRQQWRQQRENQARDWGGQRQERIAQRQERPQFRDFGGQRQERMAQRQERAQFRPQQQAQRQQDSGPRFAGAGGRERGGGGGGRHGRHD